MAVFGANHTGLPLALLLSKNNNVIIVDSNIEKVAKINRRENPLDDKELTPYFSSENYKPIATLTNRMLFNDISCAFITYETFYEPAKNSFNVTEIENTVKKILSVNNNCPIVIMSSVPVGYTSFLIKKYKSNKIFYIPEFISEYQSINSFLYPSALIIGTSFPDDKDFYLSDILAKILLTITRRENVPVLYRTPDEAESISLFDNTYKAMRTSFFNFVNVFTSVRQINTEKVNEGLRVDPIIGNNKCFPIKYGSYFFPLTIENTDKEQYKYQSPTSSIINSNTMQKTFIGNNIFRTTSYVIGIYKSVTKENNKKFFLNLISYFSSKGIKVIIFDPTIQEKRYNGCVVFRDCEQFKNECNLILAERISEEIQNVQEKIQLI